MTHQSWKTSYYGAQPFHPIQEPLSQFSSTVPPFNRYNSVSDAYCAPMLINAGQLETTRCDTRSKRSYSAFSGAIDNSSTKKVFNACNKLSTEERRKMLSCKLRFVAPNIDFWASLKNGTKFWQNENPKTLLVSLYSRQGCAAPLFMWYDYHNGIDYPMEDKIPEEYASELISCGRLFFEITFSQLSPPYASTNLRVQGVESCAATRHVACAIAIAEILLLPDVTPSAYTQEHLYSEIRLLFSVPKEFVTRVLSDINRLERNDAFFVSRFNLLKELASVFKNYANDTLIYDPTSTSQKIVSPLPKKATPRTFVIKQSQKPTLSVTIPTQFAPKQDSNAPSTSQEALKRPIDVVDLTTQISSEMHERFVGKYVVDTIHLLEGLKISQDESVFFKLSFDSMYSGPKLQELVEGLVQDVANAVEDEERPANALYMLWNAKKSEVSKLLLAGASSIFTRLCSKIEFKCSTARIMIQMVDLFTQLLALHENPFFVAQKIISKEFVSHLYTLLEWTGSFKEVNELSKAATTILSKALLILHELSPTGLPSLIAVDRLTCLAAVSALQKITGNSHILELLKLLSAWAGLSSPKISLSIRKSP